MTDTKAELIALEHKRNKLLVANDMAALGAMLADDLTYVHASGKLDTNWTTSPELSNESSAFSAIGWTRGRNQALVVGYGPDPLDSGGDGFVMVMLASR